MTSNTALSYETDKSEKLNLRKSTLLGGFSAACFLIRICRRVAGSQGDPENAEDFCEICRSVTGHWGLAPKSKIPKAEKSRKLESNRNSNDEYCEGQYVG